MTYQDYCNKINSLKAEANTFSLIDAEHPLNIFVGYNEQLFPTFMIVVEQKIDTKNIHETRSILISNGIRKDGKSTLAFSCKDISCKDIFARLCFDMLEAARKAPALEKINKLIHRYISWYKMLEGVRPDLLTPAQQKGLCGELLFLRDEIARKSAKSAVESWMGPYQADQDFIMNDMWIEVKSIKLSADNVSISSLEQLSQPRPGFLIVYKLETTNDIDSQRISLYSLATDIISLIQNKPDVLLEFQEKLLLAGCDISEKVYQHTFFCLKEKVCYEVTENFPKITMTNVSPAIASASYAISLHAIENFKKDFC